MDVARGRHLAAYQFALDRGEADPHAGLPDPVFDFAARIVPLINVDLLIHDAGGAVLMAWREDAFGRGWHVVGGIVRHRESFAERIAEVARLELGATVAAADEPCRVSQILGDERAHMISLLFRCALQGPLTLAAAGDPTRPGQLRFFAKVPAALYPTHEMYRDLFAPLRAGMLDKPAPRRGIGPGD